MLSNTGSTETVAKYVVYRLPVIAAILFYWITKKAVQQATADRSNMGRLNGQAYYTGELLNTALVTASVGPRLRYACIQNR